MEDEQRLARALQRGLEAEGFAVDICFNGIDGLERGANLAYDAIVLDIMLPGLNGYRVCAELRAAGVWAPILLLTAKDGEFDEAEGLDTGADDYLRKPFSYVVLLARLRALLRRGSRPRPALLEAGDLRLDPASHRCWRGEVELTVTAREFSLLEFLLRRPGEAISRADILRGVWETVDDTESNVVDVYVGYLRKKVDIPFGRASLETIRGVGYRLVDDASFSA